MCQLPATGIPPVTEMQRLSGAAQMSHSKAFAGVCEGLVGGEGGHVLI